MKGTWHVPVASESSDESLRTWLCITRPSSHELNGKASVNLETSEIDRQEKCDFKLSSCKSEGLRNGSCENKTTTMTGKRKDRSPSPSPSPMQRH